MKSKEQLVSAAESVIAELQRRGVEIKFVCANFVTPLTENYPSIGLCCEEPVVDVLGRGKSDRAFPQFTLFASHPEFQRNDEAEKLVGDYADGTFFYKCMDAIEDA